MVSASGDTRAQPPSVKAERLEVPSVDLLTLKPGEAGRFEVLVKVEKGFHVHANPASQTTYIATTLSLNPHPDLEWGAPEYPKAQKFRLKGAKDSIDTYGGEFMIRVPVTVKKRAISAEHHLKGLLRYQACSEDTCFLPKKLAIVLPLDIKAK